jgi:hypothetical protein
MFFKPRIFISSTLDLNNIRDRISSIFQKTGAEPLLYEKNLTPSIKSFTYRTDILESDFVIFIFEKKYGSTTDSGKSGTHEEWDVVSTNRIPAHVYIKKNEEYDDELKEFIKENIKSAGISFYYYNNEQELLEKLEASIFTIAKESFISNLSIKSLPEIKLKKLACDSDYIKSLEIIKGVEEIIDFHQAGSIDIDMTNILYIFMEPWIHKSSLWRSVFIDSRIEKQFQNMIDCIEKYSHYQSHNTMLRDNDLSLSFTSINRKILYNALSKIPTSYDHKEYTKLRKSFFNAYNSFKKMAIERKNKYDIHF